MKRMFLFAGLLIVVAVGCDTGIGNRRVLMLSPDEKQLVMDHRADKEVKTKERGIEQPKSKTEKFFNIFSSTPPELEARSEKSWDFKWSWDRGIATPGKPSADNPEYDNDGNLIVKPEIVRAFKIPDLHTGTVWDITEDKLRAVLEVEVADFKTPVIGWMSTGVLAGEQYLGMHLSKRLVPIFEIETGIAFGYDMETDTKTIGLDLLIIKF
jgi:hypothetical protein